MAAWLGLLGGGAPAQAGIEAERLSEQETGLLGGQLRSGTIQRGEVAFDAVRASDVTITSSAASYGWTRGGTEWRVQYTHNTLQEDYEPFRLFDFLGASERLTEHYDGAQASVRQRLGERWTWLAAGGGYAGFTDYRSLWFANYYRQQFSFVPGYDRPDPGGFNGSTGLRWEYQRGAGFVDATFLYAQDEIAPGWDFEPLAGGLVRGRSILHTYAPAIRFENVLSPRIRALNEFQLTVTSGRDPRYSYRGSINWALGERWVWRGSGGVTHEDPALRAWFAGGTLEFEIAPRWLVHASGLYYVDTGEIENAFLISTAAPGLETWRWGVGLRYVGERSSFSLAVAPLQADYEPVAVGTRPFTNLYRDRTWVSVQAGWMIEF